MTGHIFENIFFFHTALIRHRNRGGTSVRLYQRNVGKIIYIRAIEETLEKLIFRLDIKLIGEKTTPKIMTSRGLENRRYAASLPSNTSPKSICYSSILRI